MGAAAILLLAAAAFGMDQVTLKDGTVHKGHVVAAQGRVLELATGDGLLKIPRARIEKIEYAGPDDPASPDEAIGRPLPSPVGRRRLGEKAYILFGEKAANRESEAGFYGEAGYDLRFRQNLALGVAASHSRYDNKVRTLSKGDVEETSLAVRVRLDTGNSRRVVFSMEGGAGYFIFDHNLDSSVTAACSALFLKCEEDLGNVMGAMVGAGVRMKVGDRIRLGLRVQDRFLRPNRTFKLTDLVTKQEIVDEKRVKLDSVVFGTMMSLSF